MIPESDTCAYVSSGATLIPIPSPPRSLLGTNALTGPMPDVTQPSSSLVFVSLRSNFLQLPRTTSGSIAFTLE